MKSILLSLLLLTFWNLSVMSQSIVQLGGWQNNPNFKLKYTQDHLLVTTVGGVRNIDVSDPINPSPSGATIPNPTGVSEFSFAVEVVGNKAYLAGSYTGHFRIVDVTNINSPIQTGITYNVLGTIYQISINNNYAFAASNNDTLYAIDVSNVANPVVIGKLNIGFVGEGVYASGNYVYVSGVGGIKTINVQNPNNMSFVNTFGSSNYGKISPDPANNRFIVSKPGLGFEVINYLNPTNLVSSFSGVGGTGSSHLTYKAGKVFQINGATVDAFNLSSTAATYLCSYSGLLNGQIMDIEAKDSVFYISTTSDVYNLKLSSLNSPIDIKEKLFTVDKIQLFPNPCYDHICLKSTEFIEKISIADVNGKIVYLNANSFANTEIIDVSALEKGLYVITVSGNNYHYTEKFVKCTN